MNLGALKSQAPQLERERLSSVLKRNSKPLISRSVRQILNSVVPFLGLWVALYFSLRVSYWLTLALAVVTAAFMVRVFIIFHDCGHGSFFRSKRANEIVGFITGVLTLTPHYRWWYEHARHHATSGDLDRRGIGDIWMMTVEEYRNASSWNRLKYWCYRQPIFMLTVGPLLMFALLNRFPGKSSRRREKLSVLWCNLALVGIWTTLAFTIGLKAYLMMQIPVTVIGGAAGIWLFYVQHQYEGTYWARRVNHDPAEAALAGSSFYRLPRILQWFSGNIGFHHIHHLNSRIPNYFLERCHRELPPLPQVKRLSLRESLHSLSLRLWDEEQGRMVGFHELA